MSDIICITSSDDEEDNKSSKHTRSQIKSQKSKEKIIVPPKRKLTFTSSEEEGNNGSKRIRNNKSKAITITKDSKNKKTNNVNVKKEVYVSKNSTKCSSPKPGTSKQFDEVERVASKKAEANATVKSRFSSAPTTPQQSHPTRKVIKPQLVVKEKVPIPDPLENVFAKFLEACEKRNKDDNTNKILSNLKKRYDQLTPIDKDSEEFRLFLNGSLQKVSNSRSEKFYSHIQEVQDEIKRRMKRPSAEEKKKKKEREKVQEDEGRRKEEGTVEQKDELSEEAMRKVKKIEKTIKQCKERIKELEEEEVDFDDEENSSYIKVDRYKRKIVELSELLSNIVGDNMLKREIFKKQLRRKDIPDEMTNIESVDEAIISFINTSIKKVNKLKHIKNPTAIADYLTVPDYPDILQCIIKCNVEKNLRLSKKKMEQLALTAFKSIGHYLKKQRIQESEDYITSYIDNATEGDPASQNVELSERLQKNKKEGDKKLNEIFKKYVEKQEGLSAEDLAKEIEENSASKDESEDEFVEKDKNKKQEDKTKHNEDKSDQEVDEDEVKKGKREEKKKDQVKEKRKDKESDKDVAELDNRRVLRSRGDKTKSDKEVSETHQESIVDNVSKKNISDAESNISLNNDANEKNLISFTESNQACGIASVTKHNSPETILSIVSEICGIKNDLENNNADVLSLVVDDDEIEILSDDNEINSNRESNSTSNKESKEENVVILASNDNDDDVNFVLEDNSMEVEEDPLRKETTASMDVDVDRDSPTSVPKESDVTENVENEILDDCTTKNATSPSKLDNKMSQSTANPKEDEVKDSSKSNKAGNKSSPKKADETPKEDNTKEKNSSPAAEMQETSQSTTNNDVPTCNNELEKPSSPKDVEEILSENVDKPTSTPAKSTEIVEIIEEIEESADTKKTIEKKSSLDQKLPNLQKDKKSELEELSFIKVRSFAKPPDSWKDSLSPEKSKQDLKMPLQQALQQLSKPECVDLTSEKESRLPCTSTRIINPLAINKRRGPVKNVVVVKNVINNYNVPMSADDVRGSKVAPPRNVRLVNPQGGNSITITPIKKGLVVNEVPPNNHHQRPSAPATVIRKPFTVVPMQSKVHSNKRPYYK